MDSSSSSFLSSSHINEVLSASPPSVIMTRSAFSPLLPSTQLHTSTHHNHNHNESSEISFITSAITSANSSRSASRNASANTSPSLTTISSGSLSPSFGLSPPFSLHFILDNNNPSLPTTTTTTNNNNNNNSTINTTTTSTTTSAHPSSSNNSIFSTTGHNIHIINTATTNTVVPDGSGYLSCHTSVCIDDKIVIFGGLYKKEKRDDVLVYHITESVWDVPRIKGPIPAARYPSPSHSHSHSHSIQFELISCKYCHTACLYKPPVNAVTNNADSSSHIQANNFKSIHFSSPNNRLVKSSPTVNKLNNPTIVVFGGLANIRLNDVHLLDIETMTWSSVAPAGMLPMERSHHSAVLFGHHMVIFGGLSDTGQRLNDVHILDLEAMCWVQPLVSGTLPPPRLAHSAEVYANRMIIFGGYDGKIRMNDVYVLDFGTMRWSQPLLQGPPPIPRFGQTMTIVGSKAVVFGGSTGAANALTNDHVVVLDLETLVWSHIRPTGPTPPPLHYHTASITQENKIWYYGGVKKFAGFIVLDVDTIEVLRGRNFYESREFVHNTLNEALESLDVVFQTESLRGAPVEGIVAVTETMKNVNQSARTVFAEMGRQLHLLTEAELATKEKLKTQREELDQARAMFEAHKQNMEDINRRQLAKVKLNIGGSRYETSVATLAKDGQSMLAAMFSGLYPLSPDPEDGSIFIDRDGTHFRYILNYLRDGSFLPPREVSTLHELLQEAEFYQIKGLISLLKEYLQAHEAD